MDATSYGFTNETDAQEAHAEAVALGLTAELTSHPHSGHSRVRIEVDEQHRDAVADLVQRHGGQPEPTA